MSHLMDGDTLPVKCELNTDVPNKQFAAFFDESVIHGYNNENIPIGVFFQLPIKKQLRHIIHHGSHNALNFFLKYHYSDDVHDHISHYVGLYNQLQLTDYIPCDLVGLFTGACRGGHLSLIHSLIERGVNDWNGGLYWACRGGHSSVVNMMIDKGADKWNSGFIGACSGGHPELCKLMIERGATNIYIGLLYSCRRGHEPMIQWLIDNGANNWSTGLRGAIIGGQYSIVEKFVGLVGKNNISTDYLLLAFKCTNRQIIKLLSRLVCEELDTYLCDAINRGDYNTTEALVDVMRERGEDISDYHLMIACKNGNQKIIELLVRMFDFTWDRAFYWTCRYEVSDNVHWLISKGLAYSSYPNNVYTSGDPMSIIHNYVDIMNMCTDPDCYCISRVPKKGINGKRPMCYHMNANPETSLWPHLMVYNYQKLPSYHSYPQVNIPKNENSVDVTEDKWDMSKAKEPRYMAKRQKS